MVGSEVRSGTGAVTSFTVTVKLVLAPSGLLVQVTSVAPPGKKEPDGGLHVTVPHPVALGVTAKVTIVPHALAGLLTTIGSGGVNVQPALMELTVTGKMQSALMLRPTSVAWHVTVVAGPTLKLEPDGGTQVTVALPLLSFAVTV
jgi:hypothetical protein